jgi:drug/metabolite transporter (DMT)-like permease
MSREPQVKDQEVFGILYLGGTLLAAVISIFVVPWNQVTITMTQFWNLLYLGAIASGLGFFLWNYGARRTNIGALAIFNDFKIPLSITVSLLVFGEKASIPHLIIGGLIVLLALGMNELYEFRIRQKRNLTSPETTIS